MNQRIPYVESPSRKNIEYSLNPSTSGVMKQNSTKKQTLLEMYVFLDITNFITNKLKCCFFGGPGPAMWYGVVAMRGLPEFA